MIAALSRFVETEPDRFLSPIREARAKGGPGSGNHSHLGRPGKVGGAVESEKDNNPYGVCPDCGEPGIERERRIGGWVTCANGHQYKLENTGEPE